MSDLSLTHSGILRWAGSRVERLHVDGTTIAGSLAAPMLDVWIVYDSPSDYPGQFVARRFQVNQPTGDVLAAQTLEALRALLPKGLIRLDRTDHDQPHIVEVWV